MLGRKVSQRRVTTWTSKASQSFLFRLPSLGYELETESFFVRSGLENPRFGNLEKPGKPMAAPMPPIKTSLWAYPLPGSSDAWRQKMNYSTSMPHWRQYEFPADTSPFYHQEFKILLWQPRSTFYVRLLHMTSSNKAIFQLTTPISHRIAGVNNTSAVRTIWVTAYTFQL